MVDDRYPVRDEDVLLIVRVPPPYGGGEAVGALLERLFTGRFGILAFRRPSHQKASQGRLSAGNLLFGLRYAGRSTIRIAKDRPRVVYLDIPKDTTAFLRSSVVVLVARSLRVRVVGDLAGADFVFLRGSWLVRRYGRWVLGSIDAIRVLGESVVATLRAHGLENTVVISNGIEEPRSARSGRRQRPVRRETRVPLRRQDRARQGHRNARRSSSTPSGTTDSRSASMSSVSGRTSRRGRRSRTRCAAVASRTSSCSTDDSSATPNGACMPGHTFSFTPRIGTASR